MTEQPEPVDDSYPASWRPSWVKERDERRTAMETAASEMTEAEWAEFTKRARGN